MITQLDKPENPFAVGPRSIIGTLPTGVYAVAMGGGPANLSVEPECPGTVTFKIDSLRRGDARFPDELRVSGYVPGKKVVRIQSGDRTDLLYILIPEGRAFTLHSIEPLFGVLGPGIDYRPRIFGFPQARLRYCAMKLGLSTRFLTLPPEVEALLPDIQAAAMEYMVEWSRAKHALPLDGVPLLHESLTEKGHFIADISFKGTKATITFGHRHPKTPAEKWTLTIRATWSRGDKRVKFTKRLDGHPGRDLLFTTRTIKGALEWRTPESLFTQPMIDHCQTQWLIRALGA